MRSAVGIDALVWLTDIGPPHTVHRHVASIHTKLRQPSRAAAASHATRESL